MANGMNAVGRSYRRSFVPALLVMAGLAASVSGCKEKPRVNLTVPASELQKNNARVAADGVAFREVRLDTAGLAHIVLEQTNPQVTIMLGAGLKDYLPVERRGSLSTFQVPYGDKPFFDAPVSYGATGVEVQVRVLDASGNKLFSVNGVFSGTAK
ncbi:MAG: hypothetical protein WCW67_08300 [Candidatus Margulisiibacteriota bacterium]|jgi:hypothetical protein